MGRTSATGTARFPKYFRGDVAFAIPARGIQLHIITSRCKKSSERRGITPPTGIIYTKTARLWVEDLVWR